MRSLQLHALGFAAAVLAAAAQAGEQVTTASGLKYEVLTPGKEGPKPRIFDEVEVHYTGTLEDGTKFDSSRDRGVPAKFRLGQVIEGWNEGLQLMTPGARFAFTIPSELAYGEQGRPPQIPPSSTLLFDVELISVSPAPPLPEFGRCGEEKSTKMPNGVVWEIVKAGEVPIAQDDVIEFHRTIYLHDGRPFDSTFAEGGPQRGMPKELGPVFAELFPKCGVGGVLRVEVPSKDVFGQLPVGVKPDDPTVWHIEIIAKMDLPKFEMPREEALQTTATGLKYEVIREGSGEHPSLKSKVECHYSGWLTDGTRFDSSYTRGKPSIFALAQVIPGWTEGIQLMRPGAVYRFVIPADLAYGDAGRPPTIPGGATLVFLVELLAIQ